MSRKKNISGWYMFIIRDGLGRHRKFVGSRVEKFFHLALELSQPYPCALRVSPSLSLGVTPTARRSRADASLIHRTCLDDPIAHASLIYRPCLADVLPAQHPHTPHPHPLLLRSSHAQEKNSTRQTLTRTRRHNAGLVTCFIRFLVLGDRERCHCVGTM